MEKNSRPPLEQLRALPHILVVDDDVRLCKLIARYLRDKGWMVTCAHDATQAREALSWFKIDAMVLDVMMPQETGLAFLHTTSIAPPTLMLTAMGEAEHRIAGLEAGADDYLSKPFEPKELVLRLQKLIQRTKRYEIRNDAVHFGDYLCEMDKKRLLKGGVMVHLTDAEMGLLILLARHINHTVTRESILQEMGGEQDEQQTRMVDVLVTRLRKKIEADPARPLHLITIRGVGYCLRN
jgi:two-component system phosphate regulon response regulator OmpR